MRLEQWYSPHLAVLMVDPMDIIDCQLDGHTSLCWRNPVQCQTPAERIHGCGTGPRKGCCKHNPVHLVRAGDCV